MTPRSPDFIGIGAQKAGTCWLRENLRRHPLVWMPPIPELHYFDEPLDGASFPPRLARDRMADETWRMHALAELQRLAAGGDVARAAWWALHAFCDRGDHWYRSLFAFAPSSHVAGEITPRYMLCGPKEVATMHAVAPEAKLIFILRHPVDRFWSQCKMKRGDGTLAPGEAAAIHLFDTPNGRPRGEYSEAILRFCDAYAPDRMLVIFHDGILHRPAEVMRAVHEFLGVPPMATPESELRKPVNASGSDEAMPPRLRARVEAACRSEMDTLAEVFGGYPAEWLGSGGAPSEARPFVRLAPSHIDAIRRSQGRRAVRRSHVGKIFCVSMQRTGTTSTGDWLEAHGLVRAGGPTSMRLQWTRAWLRGDFEAIFSSAEFEAANVFEDDPWWCGDFYRVVAERFPDARFILMERDADEWFDSMCHHSGGRNPGWTDVHARVYEREAEFTAWLARHPATAPDAWGQLSIVEHRDHYKRVYRRHIESVREYFRSQHDRLFHGRLDDPGVFQSLLSFVGLERHASIPVPRSNATTDSMRRRLADYLAVGKQ